MITIAVLDIIDVGRILPVLSEDVFWRKYLPKSLLHPWRLSRTNCGRFLSIYGDCRLCTSRKRTKVLWRWKQPNSIFGTEDLHPPGAFDRSGNICTPWITGHIH